MAKKYFCSEQEDTSLCITAECYLLKADFCRLILKDHYRRFSNNKKMYMCVPK